MSWLVVELKSSAGSAPVLKSAQNYSEKPTGCLQCRFDKSVLEEWDWLSKEGRATGNVPVNSFTLCCVPQFPGRGAGEQQKLRNTRSKNVL